MGVKHCSQKRSCSTFCPRCSCLFARVELPANDPQEWRDVVHCRGENCPIKKEAVDNHNFQTQSIPCTNPVDDHATDVVVEAMVQSLGWAALGV